MHPGAAGGASSVPGYVGGASGGDASRVPQYGLVAVGVASGHGAPAGATGIGHDEAAPVQAGSHASVPAPAAGHDAAATDPTVAPGSGSQVRMSQLARIPFSELIVRRIIGRGAFGVVEECMWHGTSVAVKCNGVGATDGVMMTREVQLYERLQGRPHENIVQVFGVCVDAPDGNLRLVMRLCVKGPLDDFLASSRPSVSLSGPDTSTRLPARLPVAVCAVCLCVCSLAPR
jgi:hypothetical protein